MKHLIQRFKRTILRQHSGWVSGQSYELTVPHGKWHIGQKITIKANGKLHSSKPTITRNH